MFTKDVLWIGIAWQSEFILPARLRCHAVSPSYVHNTDTWRPSTFSVDVGEIKFQSHNGSFPVLLSKVEVSAAGEQKKGRISFWTGNGTLGSNMRPHLQVSAGHLTCTSAIPSMDVSTGALLVHGGFGESREVGMSKKVSKDVLPSSFLRLMNFPISCVCRLPFNPLRNYRYW